MDRVEVGVEVVHHPAHPAHLARPQVAQGALEAPLGRQEELNLGAAAALVALAGLQGNYFITSDVSYDY